LQAYFFVSLVIFEVNGKGKGKRTGLEGPEVEWMYSYTLSLTSALYWVGGQRHAPAAPHPRE